MEKGDPQNRVAAFCVVCIISSLNFLPVLVKHKVSSWMGERGAVKSAGHPELCKWTAQLSQPLPKLDT